MSEIISAKIGPVGTMDERPLELDFECNDASKVVKLAERIRNQLKINTSITRVKVEKEK